MNAMVEATPITPVPVVPMAPQPMTPMELAAFVIQQGKDPALIDKMIEWQERHEKKMALRAFDAAVANAKAEIKPILKNREVDFQSKREGAARTNYEYEDLGAIAEHVDPILAKYGLSYRHRPKQEGKNLTITCILSHRDGHREETSLTAPNDETGNKNAGQAIASTATLLQRYTLKLALGLSTTRDDDGHGASAPETITDVQLGTLERELEAIKATDAERAAFLQYLEVDELAKLPASEFQRAMQSIKDKARAKRQQQSRAAQ
jgi:hypothetical protein